MKYDELYSSYDNEELDIKMALEATGMDPLVAAEAAKIYQQDKAQDLIFTEKTLAAGSNFDTVHRVMRSNIQRRLKSRPKFDTKLRNALIKANKLPDVVNKYQAHHIVAKGAQLAKRAMEILQALGIDIDDIVNGVFLPAREQGRKRGPLKKAYAHNQIHTKPYYANINFKIVRMYERTAHKDAGDQKTDMMKLLERIAKELQNGQFPIHHYIPGAELT